MNPVEVPRIVAFAKDWNDVPTSTMHVPRMMGRTMPVLWVESIGTRKVSLAIGKDWMRVWRRFRLVWKGAENIENQVRVLAPLLIPKAQSKKAQYLNRWLFWFQTQGEMRRMGRGSIEYWCFVPNAVDLLPKHKDGYKVIYYCVDDWSQFHNLDGAWLAKKDRELLQRADVVFAVSRSVENKCRQVAGDKVYYMPHGADHALFAKALDPKLEEPRELAGLPHPRIGFYGNLHDWVDLELIEALARSHADWNFVLIGEVYCDVTRLTGLANVHLLGRREHADLPRYCGGFDVAVIPYDMKQRRMESVNPIKTKELLAAGVPIAAADIPELRGYGDDVLLCRTVEEWSAAISRQVSRRDRHEISRRVAGENWDVKVEAMRKIVEDVAC